ncbi:MAG: benzoyl-CoA reductase subunit C [FCB group bacterium]|nr:benzoyl-CoA reductase subunit C [FCB group bacterium]
MNNTNSTVTQIIETCERLYNDLDFSYVKNWKQTHAGKAVGFMPIYVPREIVHAAGMLPVGLMGAGDLLEIIKGDAYFQSYICQIPRSTIEMAISNRLDCFDGMLFPAICDVIRNLSGMWKLMFPEKYARYMDFPQNFRPEVGGEYYHQELIILLKDMATLSGAKVTQDQLRQSVRLYNENRAVIRELYDLRSADPHLVPTYELYLIMRASNILEVSEHTAMVRDYLGAVRSEKRPERDNIRVVLSGVFCEQPPLALIRALENSGCFIVEDDWVLGARYLLKAVATEGDPLENLAAAYLKDTVKTASRYEEDGAKGSYLIDLVEKTRAEGVIFAAPSFCDPALLERPMQQEALKRADIPYTSFKYSESSGQFQVIKEQTGTFADSIKLWGSV